MTLGNPSSGFGTLMPNFVKDILMVASPYDCFILEEDGRFSDQLLSEYGKLDLSVSPHFAHVTSAKEAKELMRTRRFDLVLTTPHCADATPRKLANLIRKKDADLPIVMLTYDRTEAASYAGDLSQSELSGAFLWTGDPKLLVALVKSVEDAKNVQQDTRTGSVRVIILVEDDPAFYSSFLPLLYDEVLHQFNSLLPERLNERDRFNRMRARPKILLAHSYEQASDLFKRYREYLMGIFCDVRFPRKQTLDIKAGPAFIRKVRKHYPNMPILLNSWNEKHRSLAGELDVLFAHKKSPQLYREIREFLKDNCGFGDFVFRSPDGTAIDRAQDLQGMLQAIARVDGPSLRYHAQRQDFSNWLMARSEFALAKSLQPHQPDESEDTDAIRRFLLDILGTSLVNRQRGQVTDFPHRANLLARDFTRIGRGSMGGKSRGIAFVAHMLANSEIHDKYPGLRIRVPWTTVICTDFFDRFCNANDLRARALAADSDKAIAEIFLAEPLDAELTADLEKIVDEVRCPLAVRSSSLLEDSTYQPLAGIYETFILPNCSQNREIRLEQLSRAVRLVVASAFYSRARRYLSSNSFRPEQEKMAVIVQELVGTRFGDHFYPDFAGVAQSYNYYPLRFLKAEDGIATVALGLGRTVVEGRRALRFSPSHPNILPQMSTPKDTIEASQRDFFALNLGEPDQLPDRNTAASLSLLDLAAAERDGTLSALGATYSDENNIIYDSIYRQGLRIVNFAGVLKFDRFPLAPLLRDMLDLCEAGMGSPVELEFAVVLDREDRPAEFAMLELRPLVAMGNEMEVALDPFLGSPLLLKGRALGNGVVNDIRDVVYLHPNRFQLGDTRALVREIERINHRLSREKRPYLLLGPGRWGTADHWMGVPVTWSQVSGVKVIVELELPKTNILPSQGTHFFHNLTSLRVGYFSVDATKPDHQLNLDWLESQQLVEETHCIRHVALETPLEVRIDGRSGHGLVLQKSGVA